MSGLRSCVFAGLALLGAACGEPPGPVVTIVGERSAFVHPGAPHAAQVSASALALGADGTPHLAWIRTDATETSVQLASLRTDGFETHRVDTAGDTAVSRHQSPGLAVGADGRVHVSWSTRRRDADGSHFASDLVVASASREAGFGKPIVLNDDTSGSRGFEGIGVAADGSLVAAWIESGPVSRTRVARVGVDGARESRVLDERSCPCCRLAVATDALGRVALLWRDESEASVRDMVVSFAEADAAFSAPVRVHEDRWVLEACPHRGGALAFASGGRVAVAWYTEGEVGRPQLLLAVGDANGFGAPLPIHRAEDSQPDRVALALDRDGRGIVLWERRTAVRSEIAARAILAGPRLGPVRVISQTLHASHPQVQVSATGRFVAAWSEESFPTQRTVVAELAPTAE